MQIAKFILLIWALVLALFLAPRAIASPTPGSLLAAAIVAALFISSVGCADDNRICWLVCLLICLLVLIRFLPMVAINTFMAFTGHELYQDSPATFIIVMMYAVIFVIPPVAVFTCVAIDWRSLVSVFRGSSAPEETSRGVKSTKNTNNPYQPPSE